MEDYNSIREQQQQTLGYIEYRYLTQEEQLDVQQKVKNALSQIRPYLQQDGGDVEYADITAEGVVIVRLKGHCGSCPHAMATLKQGIEQAIKKVIPEIKSVEKI